MSEWPMVKLGNITKELSSRLDDLDLPIYSVTKHDGFVPSAEYFKKQVFSENVKNYKLCRSGDFAYATIHLDEGSIGIAPIDCGISPMYTTFRIESSDAHPEFLLGFLKSYRALAQYRNLGSGSAERRKSINYKNLSKLEIPFPPLGEQKRIAEILGSIQNAIELTSLQLDDISSSMKIESWTLTRDSPQTQLSHYIKKITSGKSLKEGNWENFQNCILKISAVTTGFFDDSEIKPLPESYTPQASHKVNTGDILLSRANTTELVGASAIVENAANNLYLPDKLWKLHIKDDVDTYFFWHLLQTKPVRSSISKASSGSGGSMKNISQKSFLNITVPKISREVQNQIGKNIRLQHILRSLLIKKLNLLQELQRSLSVRAFAGEL